MFCLLSLLVVICVIQFHLRGLSLVSLSGAGAEDDECISVVKCLQPSAPLSLLQLIMKKVTVRGISRLRLRRSVGSIGTIGGGKGGNNNVLKQPRLQISLQSEALVSPIFYLNYSFE